MAGILDGMGDDFVGSVKRGAGAYISQGARALQDAGIDTAAAQAYGNQLVADNPAKVNSIADMRSNPITALSESVGGAAPGIASALGAAKIGQMAGTALGGAVGRGNPAAEKIGGIAGGIVGQAVPDLLTFYGGNRQQQDAAGIDSPGAAAAGALGQAALNQAPLLPVKRLLRIPGTGEAARGIGDIAKDALKFGAIGAATAPAQEAISRAQSGQSVAPGEDTDYTKSAIEGGTTGAVLGAGSASAERLLDHMKLGHAIQPQTTVVDPGKGPISRATVRGANDGAVDGVVTPAQVRASLPTFEHPFVPEQAPSPAAQEFHQEQPADYSAMFDGRAINIPAGKNLKSTERVVEQRAAQQVLADPMKAVADYSSLPGTDGGRIINTDEARELFPDYGTDANTRSAFSYAVHEPASWVAKEQYANRLAQPVGEGMDPVVMFTAGGTGAGKSTAIKRVEGLKDAQDKADIVYDGNLQSFASAKTKIDQALESGRAASIVYVNRDPIESFTHGAIPRAAKDDYGRTVPFDAHADTHIGAAQTISQLAEHYKDNPNVDIRIVNNEKNAAKIGGVTDVSHVAGMNRDTLISELKNGLEQQRQAGNVPDRVYDFYRGAAEDGPEGSQRGDAGDLQREGARQDAGGDGSEPAQPGQAEDLTGARASAAEDDRTQTPEFKSWFGESKVVDEKGAPIRVYHGTGEDISVFKTKGGAGKTSDTGAFFTSDPGNASTYADGKAPNVVPAYLSIKHPLVVDAGGVNWSKIKQSAKVELHQKDGSVKKTSVRQLFKGEWDYPDDTASTDDIARLARKSGHDGVVFKGIYDNGPSGQFTDENQAKPKTVYAAFDPTQIKSAIGNSGSFDATNPDIRARVVDPNVPVNGKGLAPRAVSDLVSRQTKNWKSGPAVEVVPTNAHLPEAVRSALGNKPVDGAYDGSGKIYVVADKVNSAKDVRRIIAHEGYAHYGVKGVLGDKFGEFLSKLDGLKDTDLDIKKAYEATQSRYGDLSPEARADEIVAHMAENFDTLKGRAKALVSQIVSAVKDFLRKTLNIQTEMSAHDVRAIIAKAKGALSKAKPEDLAASAEARAANPPAATEPVAASESAARASATPPAPADSFDGWTHPSAKLDRYLTDSAGARMRAYLDVAKQKSDKLRTMFQDYFLPVRRVQEAITAHGGKVEESSDVYGREELYYGRTGSKLEALERDHVKPLAKAIADSGVSLDDAELYLYAKFAPERNARIASINPELQDGGSGMTNADAAKVVDDFKKQGLSEKLDKIADRVYALNEVRVNALEESGLISKEAADAWREDKHYVPLKGFADGVDDEAPATRPPIGAGFSVGGKEAWRALGRRSRAADIIANAVAQTDQAIIRAEKNRVAQALLKLAQDNPNKALWEVNATQNKAGFDKGTGEVVYRKTNEPDAVIAKVNGEEYRINIRDQRFLEAMKNMGSAKVGAVLRSFGAINRVLSATRTMYSPEFVVSNLARDIQTAGVNLVGKMDAKTAAKAITVNMPHAIKAMWGQLGGKKVGGEWARWAQEFDESGAMTHFVNQKTVEERQAKIEGLIKQAQGGGRQAAANLLRGTAEFINHLNGTIENGTRLSAYAEARRSGASIEQAARLAKNLTVNFNRKGQYGSAMNAMFLFYNASIQGAWRFMHAMKSPAVQGIMASTAALGFGLGYYNRVVGGKDDDGQDMWDKVPDFERERNLVVMNAFGKGSNLKIPMPYTYNLPFLVGQNIADMTFGKKDAAQGAMSIANALINAFDPLGSVDLNADATQGIVKTASPTVLQPFVDLAFNRDNFGSPIKPQQDPNAKVKLPDSETFFKGSTNPQVAALARELNRLTGGNPVRSGGIDVSPASMTYLFDYLTGGTGSFVDRVATSVGLAARGEDVPVNKIPFVRTFVSQPQDSRVNDTYYAARDDVNQKAEMAKVARKPGAFPDATANEKEEMRFGVSLESSLRTTDKALSELRRVRLAAQSSGNDAKVKEIEQKERDVMTRFNRVYFQRKEAGSTAQ